MLSLKTTLLKRETIKTILIRLKFWYGHQVPGGKLAEGKEHETGAFAFLNPGVDNFTTNFRILQLSSFKPHTGFCQSRPFLMTHTSYMWVLVRRIKQMSWLFVVSYFPCMTTLIPGSKECSDIWLYVETGPLIYIWLSYGWSVGRNKSMDYRGLANTIFTNGYHDSLVSSTPKRGDVLGVWGYTKWTVVTGDSRCEIDARW